MTTAWRCIDVYVRREGDANRHHWIVESEYDRVPYDSRQSAIAAAVHRAKEVGALLMIYEADGKLDAPVNF